MGQRSSFAFGGFRWLSAAVDARRERRAESRAGGKLEDASEVELLEPSGSRRGVCLEGSRPGSAKNIIFGCRAVSLAPGVAAAEARHVAVVTCHSGTLLLAYASIYIIKEPLDSDAPDVP